VKIMRPCRQCRAPIENSFVLCPHCRAPQSDVWQKPSPAPESKPPRTGRQLLRSLLFPSEQTLHGCICFLGFFVLPIVMGAGIGYSENGTSGAVVGMFGAFALVILIAFVMAAGNAGG
jgi:hypothetical protein